MLIGVRVIDSIWLRRSLRDEHRVAGCPHGLFSPSSYPCHWHVPVLSHVCTDFHTMHTHGVVMKHWWSYPCPAPGLRLPILGWQSSVAVAQGALDTTQRAGPFLQEQLRTPQASLLLPTIAFILLPPTLRGCPEAELAPPEWALLSRASSQRKAQWYLELFPEWWYFLYQCSPFYLISLKYSLEVFLLE